LPSKHLDRLLDSGVVRRLEPIGERLVERMKLADRSLYVKFAAAPGAMLVLLVLAAILNIGALLHAQSSTNLIVARHMHNIDRLNAISSRFERSDGDIYRLLIAKAAGGQDVDVPARAGAIKAELGRVRRDLAALRPELSDQAALDRTLTKIDNYAASVDVITAMLDIDFASSATMLEPFRANAAQVVHEVNAFARRGVAEADARAESIAFRIRLMVAFVVIVTLVVALFGMVLTRLIGRATVRSIMEIADATSELAQSHYGVDLDALDRQDELGAVVGALKTFRCQAIESERLHAEKAALEGAAKEEEARRQAAVAQAMRDAEAERRETLDRLAEAFDRQVKTMIAAARQAMEHLDHSSAQLDRSADNNRALSGELEELAAVLTGEMERAGTVTGALTASIREVGREVGQTSDVARSILEHADRARVAVADSERKAEDVDGIVDVIDEIARQTRLLALNATIEAARAGEVGRGFGVVASEIKSLSSRTGNSTQDVRAQVGAMQRGIGRIVEVTTQLSGLIEAMNKVSSRVATASADQVRSTDEIDERIGAVRVRTQALVQASAAIRTSAVDNQAFVRDLRDAGSALHDSIGRLAEDAQMFTAYLRAG
jgi:methyl-accepting chemotaxis protein